MTTKSEAPTEKKGVFKRLNDFQNRVEKTKCFIYGSLVLRLVDWVSDFTLLIAFTVIFTYLPDFYIAQEKPDASGRSNVRFALRDQNHYCEMEFGYTAQDCSNNEEYTKDITHSELVSGVINYCPDTGTNTYIYKTMSQEDPDDWPFSACCIREKLDGNDMSMKIVATCEKGSSRLTTDLVISESVPWLCSLDDKNPDGSGFRASRCSLTDPFLLNTLTVFAFVIIAKELLVIVSYEFCVFYLEDEDLTQLSADSILLLVVSVLRMTRLKKRIVKGNMKVSDNRIFFIFWGVLDFTEKIISATITWIILSAVFNALILLVFVSSLLSFLLSLKFWYKRIRTFLLREIHGIHPVGSDDGEEDQATNRSPKVSIDAIVKENLPMPTLWVKFSYFFTYFQLVIPSIRFIVAISILYAWSLLQFEDFIVEDNATFVDTKFLGAAFIVFVFSEYGLISTHFAVARGLLRIDIFQAFMQSWSRNMISQMSYRHHAMILKVKQHLSWAALRTIDLFESPHPAELVVYAGQVYTVFELSVITKKFMDQSDEGKADHFQFYYDIMLLYMSFSAALLGWTLFGFVFRNKHTSSFVSCLCCLGDLNISDIRRKMVPFAFLDSVRTALTPPARDALESSTFIQTLRNSSK